MASAPAGPESTADAAGTGTGDATFLATGVFLVGDFLAVDVVAVGDFFEEAFVAGAGFFAGAAVPLAFFAGAFLAGAFVAAAFFAGAFLAGAFLVAGFFAAAFLAGAFFAAAFLAAAFAAGAAVAVTGVEERFDSETVTTSMTSRTGWERPSAAAATVDAAVSAADRANGTTSASFPVTSSGVIELSLEPRSPHRSFSTTDAANSSWDRVRSASRGSTPDNSATIAVGSWSNASSGELDSESDTLAIVAAHPEDRKAAESAGRDDGDCRAVLVANRAHRIAPTAELARMNDHEATLAGELTLTLDDDSLGELGIAAINGGFFFFVILAVVRGGDPVLEDGVEIGLDVVGIRVFVVLVVVAGTRPVRRHGGFVLFLVLFDDLVAFDDIGDVVIQVVVDDLSVLEFGLVHLVHGKADFFLEALFHHFFIVHESNLAHVVAVVRR